jgi:hypothetical protein
VLNIATIASYLAWPSKRVSHLITTHPSTVISIIKQIQASIKVKQSDLVENEENAREKQNIQIYKIKYQLPLKPSHKDDKHQFRPTNQKSKKDRGVW